MIPTFFWSSSYSDSDSLILMPKITSIFAKVMNFNETGSWGDTENEKNTEN